MSDLRPQVLVAGGGPGGSTAAALLARQGLDVLLVEKAVMPRYHIGESLLPSCLKIFDLLGLRERIEGYGFQRKDGGYFDWAGEVWEVDFSTPAKPLYGFQVIRSEFDQLLLDHAREQGVTVWEGTEVRDLAFEDRRPVRARCETSDGERRDVSFDTLVDASGRAGLMSRRYLKNRRYHDAFMNVAVWGYWRDAKRLSTGLTGAIATCSIPLGWTWAIPLHDDTLSVGVVLHRDRLKQLRKHQSLEAIYESAVASSRVLTPLLEGAELTGPLRSETDYSYAAETFAEPGYFLVGDAACFLDPLLSTGVHLAMFSALTAAAGIASVLRGEVEEEEATTFYDSTFRRAYLRMLVVVSSFYQTHVEKDVHFKRAQRLSARDYQGEELIDAFINIVSGVEDLYDVEELRADRLVDVMTRLYDEHYSFVRRRQDWEGLPLDEIQRGMARLRVVDDVQEEFSLTPRTATNGLYVVEDPLGLARAGHPVTVATSSP
ncbi:MAG: tryptophan 7-halogenase [Gemmatimonadetes bacterium]|nr:tryptophan 7-halogenase [Gemmatimonadota bacterium]